MGVISILSSPLRLVFRFLLSLIFFSIEKVLSAMPSIISKETVLNVMKYLGVGQPSIVSGTITEMIHLIPTYLRSDGTLIKLGGAVSRDGSENVYTLRNIMVHSNLSEVTLTLSPIEIEDNQVIDVMNEELVCYANEVSVTRKDIVSIDVARDGMEKVIRCLATCPRDVQVDSLG